MVKRQGLWYSVTVRDHHGKVVSCESRRAHSFLKQWNELIYAHLNAGGAVTIKDTSGINRSHAAHANDFVMNGGAGVTSYGIVVGTGITPVTLSDYAVGTPIAEGTGAGQMNYLATSVGQSTITPPICGFTISRSAVNNSGAIITVREAGLYVRMGASYYACVVRDIFASPQDVPHEGAITANFTLQVSA